MSGKHTLKTLKKLVYDEKAEARAVLEEFRELIDTKPVYAFKWSDRAFNAAADLEVLGELARYLEMMANLAEDLPDAEARIEIETLFSDLDSISSRLANRGLEASSTSVASNLMERRLGLQWMERWSQGVFAPDNLRGVFKAVLLEAK